MGGGDERERIRFLAYILWDAFRDSGMGPSGVISIISCIYDIGGHEQNMIIGGEENGQ
jgi:hypothetical protein